MISEHNAVGHIRLSSEWSQGSPYFTGVNKLRETAYLESLCKAPVLRRGMYHVQSWLSWVINPKSAACERCLYQDFLLYKDVASFHTERSQQQRDRSVIT